MPSAHILRSSALQRSFRVEQVLGMFDVPAKDITQEWNITLPIDEKTWNIGLICGPSGSGKTTIAREIFGDNLKAAADWPQGSILEGFPRGLETKAIVEMLTSVGLSSPPHWLKPYAHLSTGQRFRADLARALLSGDALVAYDEFTSVVDRDVAKVCSAALAKTIRRRQSPRFVAVSCHVDILDWLQPDWVFDVAANRFEWRRLRRRPPIELAIHKVHHSAWSYFKGHHYLTADLLVSAQCFVAFWGDRPVAFCSYCHQACQNPRVKREHRTVVLPDYQGIGIGNAVSEAVAQSCVDAGWFYTSVTSHPAMAWHRARSPLWKCFRLPSHRQLSGGSTMHNGVGTNRSSARLTASFRYIGTPKGTIAPDTADRQGAAAAPTQIQPAPRTKAKKTPPRTRAPRRTR